MSENMTRVYELGYLLVPSLSEGDVAQSVATLTEVITSQSATVVAEGAPEFIDLAYQMERDIAGKKMKWTQGYFGWIKFEAAPEALELIKKAFDLNTSLIRYMLIKTSVDNTVIFKKPKHEAKRADASIDEMLAEAEGEVVDEEEMIDDHERLPDLAADIVADETEKETE